MDYNVGVYWNTGNFRLVNQDSILVLQGVTRRGRVLLAAVCDGMGGAYQGENASGYVTEELYTWFYDGLLQAIAKKKPSWVIRRSLERKVYQIQSRMCRYAAKQGIAFGTTMSVLFLWEKRFFIWHLGDSRIYRLSNRKAKQKRGQAIRQMTKDHAAGEHTLTKCVGSFGFFSPDFQRGKLKSKDAFLLCSDGFYRKQEKKELAEVLAPCQRQTVASAIEKRLRELGNAAIRRGEKDNMSAVYINILR